jgi:LEA14-like dessication related protein
MRRFGWPGFSSILSLFAEQFMLISRAIDSTFASVLLAASLAGGLGGCRSPQSNPPAATQPQPEDTSVVRLLSSRPAVPAFDSIRIVNEIQIRNPHEVELALAEPQFSLMIDGNVYASGVVPQRDRVGALTTKRIEVVLNISFEDVLQKLQNVQPGSLADYQAEIKLTLRGPGVGATVHSVTARGKLPIIDGPNVEIEKVVWSTLTKQQAVGKLQLRVTNTNSFPIDMERLGLDILFNEVRVLSTVKDWDVPLKPKESSLIEIPISFSPGGLGFSSVRTLSGPTIRYRMTANTVCEIAEAGLADLSRRISGHANVQQ